MSDVAQAQAPPEGGPPQAVVPAEAAPQATASADELFPPHSADELFPPAVEQRNNVMRAFADRPGTLRRIWGSFDFQNPRGTEDSALGRIATAAAKGFMESGAAGWQTLQLSEENEKALTDAGVLSDYRKGEFNVNKALTRALFNTTAAIAAGGNGLLGAFQGGAAQTGKEAGAPGLGQALAAMPEAFMGTPHPTGVPHVPELKPAPRVGLNLPGHHKFAGMEALRDGSEPPNEFAGSEATQDGSEPPDIQAAAAQIAPDAVQADRDLAKRQEVMTRWADDLFSRRQQEAETAAPHADEINRLTAEIEAPDTTPAERKPAQARLAPLIEERQAHLDDATEGDTPEIKLAKERLAEVERQRAELAPQVTEAYRQARAAMPDERSAPSAAAPADGGGIPTQVPQEPTQIPPAEPVSHESPPPVDIAADTSTKLIAAGRPADEARIAGEWNRSLWETRAARFKGAKGTAE